MENAIEHAAMDIKHQEEEKHNNKDGTVKVEVEKSKDLLPRKCCNKLEEELKEGRNSPLLRSPVTNRKEERREGVAERNLTERSLVTKSLENLLQDGSG